MKLFVTTALALCLSVASAQTFTDPANLRGERVQPRDGRELPVDQAARGLEQLLRKLNTRASVMNIVAHPDDEDGGMLTLYSRGLGARVADLSLNRGEGGQNAMTADFEDALGLLRTQELLASDRYTGVDQFFGTEVDFGFSKTKEEAFAKWGHDRVLYDVVRAIRLYRPLVLTSTWIGGVTDGHGQHQAAGQIAQEAFVAAGDPKVFPELTAEGILPWQPLRIYARVPMQAITDKGLFDYATGQYTPARFTNYVTGEVTTTVPSADVIVHEGTPDPLLTNASGNQPFGYASSAKPLTYVQFARLGLGQQKSQVSPTFHPAPSGAYDVAYHLYGDRTPRGFSLGSHSPRKDAGFSPEGMPSANADPNFFTGIDTSIEGIANLAPNASSSATRALKTNLKFIADKITEAQQTFNPAQPELTAKPLSEALNDMDLLIRIVDQLKSAVPENEKANVLHELRVKRVQLNEALIDAFGLYISTGYTGMMQVAGQPLHLSQQPHLVQSVAGKLTFVRGWSRSSSNEGLTITPPPDAPHFALGHPLDFPCDLPPAQITVTRPYFLRDNIEQPVYRLLNPTLRNAPATPPALTCWAELSYQGAHLLSTRIEIGAVTLDAFVPAVNPHLFDKTIVLPRSATSFSIRASVEPQATAVQPLSFDLPTGWTTTLTKSFGSYSEFRVDATPAPTAPVTLQAKATLADGSASFTETFLPIGYPGVPSTNYFTAATIRVVPVDLKLPATTHLSRIAYIPGTGDAVVPTLISLGIVPHVLSLESIDKQPPQLWYGMKPADLSQFDTIILGVRTYAAHPELHGAPTQALLNFTHNGGNVVVQYQISDFTTADAPYPLSLGSNETVVDETAPVQLLGPTTSGSSGTNGYPEASASGLIAGEKEGVLTPRYALLNEPNKLTPADFNNWVEERGHGFLATWDAHYTALTETHDPGQLPQRGGLITTPLGKGRWTYVAFALYRQLPEAVPGAFRLFINLINP